MWRENKGGKIMFNHLFFQSFHTHIHTHTHIQSILCIYGLHLSSSQHPCSAHWTPMRPNKLVPVRIRPSLEYHLNFTHCYHPELPHMVIQKTLCVALVYQHIIFISSSSLSLPTALLSLSLSLSVLHSLRLSLSLSLT